MASGPALAKQSIYDVLGLQYLGEQIGLLSERGMPHLKRVERHTVRTIHVPINRPRRKDSERDVWVWIEPTATVGEVRSQVERRTKKRVLQIISRDTNQTVSGTALWDASIWFYTGAPPIPCGFFHNKESRVLSRLETSSIVETISPKYLSQSLLHKQLENPSLLKVETPPPGSEIYSRDGEYSYYSYDGEYSYYSYTYDEGNDKEAYSYYYDDEGAKGTRHNNDKEAYSYYYTDGSKTAYSYEYAYPEGSAKGAEGNDSKLYSYYYTQGSGATREEDDKKADSDEYYTEGAQVAQGGGVAAPKCSRSGSATSGCLPSVYSTDDKVYSYYALPAYSYYTTEGSGHEDQQQKG